jgi:transposase
MSRVQTDPLRPLQEQERRELETLSRSRAAAAAQGARARALLAVAAGQSYSAVAHVVGRQNGDTVRHWVSRFNGEGVSAVVPRHGGGPPIRYTEEQERRLLAAVQRTPDGRQDGPATWSLSTLQTVLRRTEKSFATVSRYTLGTIWQRAGLSGQKSRRWCETGVAVRARQQGVVEREDIDAAPPKS